jgi:hypothetical protein
MNGGLANNAYMMNQSGERINDVLISFPQCFATIPTVSVAFAVIDGRPGNSGGTSSLNVTVAKVTPCDAIIRFGVWNDYRASGLAANWIAYSK